jgi:drug/metabolite transporter (DMT)-like permease
MTNSRRGLTLAFLSTAAASGFLTSYKVAASRGNPTDAVVVMLASAAILNSVTSTLQDRGHAKIPLDPLSLWLSFVLACLTLAGNACAAGAVARLSPPLASVMQQTQVLFVALLGRVLLSERVSRRFWVGVLIAAVGLCILNFWGKNAGRLDGLGALFAVGSAVCFGAIAVLTRRYIHRIRPVAVNALRLWMAVALWFVVQRRLPALPLSTEFVVACVVTGAFGPFLSRTSLMYALRYMPPTETTLIALLTPALTLLPAFLVFGTVPAAHELVGGALMIAGVALPVLERRANEN